MFVASVGKYSSPSGILSVISFAYPSIVPSLYTLIVYITVLPVSNDIGSLVCLYVAVVIFFPFSSIVPNFDVSTTGSLKYIT